MDEIVTAPKPPDTQVIKKDNRIIEAQYKLSVHQQRVVYSILELIHPSDEDFKHYNVSLADIADRFGLEKSNSLYEQMQEAISDLVTKKLVVMEGSDTIVMAWLSYARYRKGQGLLEISFHKDLKPYLLQLKSHFTQYNIASVIQFKSSYSIRFYELLKMNEYLGKGGQFYRAFSLQTLRKYLQIDQGTYENFKDFRVRVIEPAVKEINDYSDITILQVDYVKTGRAVTDVRITAKPRVDKEAEHITQLNEDISDVDLDALVSLGVTDEAIKKWVKKYGKSRVMRNVAYTLAMREDGKVTNVNAYLSKSIQDDYGMQAENQSRVESDKASKKKQTATATQKRAQQEQQDMEVITRLFESLDESQKNAILDQVAGRLKSLDLARFAVARNAYTSHREQSYMTHFKAILQENGYVLEN